MTILGIERITYGVTDLDTCRRFFADWGLKEVAHDKTRARFETLNGCEVLLALASNDRQTYCHVYFEKPRYGSGRIISVSFSTAPNE